MTIKPSLHWQGEGRVGGGGGAKYKTFSKRKNSWLYRTNNAGYKPNFLEF